MKKYFITVNGNKYEVEVEEIDGGEAVSQKPVERRVEQTVAPKAQVKDKPEEKKKVDIPEGAETVEAPMPGTILNINVNEGDTVTAGQVLLILEAMKMENEIVAPRDGKISNVLTTKGASVNSGDKLLTIE